MQKPQRQYSQLTDANKINHRILRYKYFDRETTKNTGEMFFNDLKMKHLQNIKNITGP